MTHLRSVLSNLQSTQYKNYKKRLFVIIKFLKLFQLITKFLLHKGASLNELKVKTVIYYNMVTHHPV